MPSGQRQQTVFWAAVGAVFPASRGKRSSSLLSLQETHLVCWVQKGHEQTEVNPAKGYKGGDSWSGASNIGGEDERVGAAQPGKNSEGSY